MTINPNQNYLVSDVAKHFCCSKKKIYRLIKQRKIRAIRFGDQLIVTGREIQIIEADNQAEKNQGNTIRRSAYSYRKRDSDNRG